MLSMLSKSCPNCFKGFLEGKWLNPFTKQKQSLSKMTLVQSFAMNSLQIFIFPLKGSMFLVGCSMGFIEHYWYCWLGRMYVGRNMNAVAKKVLVDQIICAPGIGLWYFIGKRDFWSYRACLLSPLLFKHKIRFPGWHFEQHIDLSRFRCLVYRRSLKSNCSCLPINLAKKKTTNKLEIIAILHALILLARRCHWGITTYSRLETSI